MITPNMDTIQDGDFLIYTSEIDFVKNLDRDKLMDEFWSDEFLGVNRLDDGTYENQGPGVHVTLDDENFPHFFQDTFNWGLTLARSLRTLEGKSLNLLNKSAWIIAASEEHTPYWHSHRRNIEDPRTQENTDTTYTVTIYFNEPSCGSPYSDLLLAHKDDYVSVPIKHGTAFLFDGRLFHRPQLVPAEFGWRYCAVCDFLFEE